MNARRCMQAGHCSQFSSRLSYGHGVPPVPRGQHQVSRLNLSRVSGDGSGPGLPRGPLHTPPDRSTGRGTTTSAPPQCTQLHLGCDFTDDTQDLGEASPLHDSFPGVFTWLLVDGVPSEAAACAPLAAHGPRWGPRCIRVPRWAAFGVCCRPRCNIASVIVLSMHVDLNHPAGSVSLFA